MRQIAKYSDLCYIPSTSRLQNELFNSNIKDYNILLLKGGFSKENIQPSVLFGISDIVDALIVRGNGEPKEILAQAFALRNKTENIRKRRFYNDIYTCLFNNEIVKDYQKRLDSMRSRVNNTGKLIAGKREGVIGLFQKIINDNIFNKWHNIKKNNGDIKHIAELFLSVDEERKSIIHKRFLRLCYCKGKTDNSLFMLNVATNVKKEHCMDKEINQIGVQIYGDGNSIENICITQTQNNSLNGINDKKYIEKISLLVNDLSNRVPFFSDEISNLNKASPP
jgi:hypothetical protein